MYHNLSGYITDYSSPLPYVVRPLIAKRDQRRSANSLDPAIQLINRDIQRPIRRKWRNFLIPPISLPTRKSLSPFCVNWGERRWNPPPNITISFDGKKPIQLVGGDCSSLQWAIYCLFKIVKRREQSLFCRSISLLCSATKIHGAAPPPEHRGGSGKWLLPACLQTEVGTSPPRPCSLLLLGFNHRKPPSRTTAIAVDISEASDMVSHCLLIEPFTWMACGIHPRQEGMLSIPIALFAFPPGTV